MKAAERMAYYAARLPLVEIDATYRWPPTPDVARQWVERTPEGFTIDVRAWSLLTGQATFPASLWEDLHSEVRPEARDRPRLYLPHLTQRGRAEAWRRFGHAIRPLVDAGRLGAVTLLLPHWMKAGDTGRSLLAEARRRLPEYRLAAEFTHPSWLEGDACEATFALLEELDIAFVCVDVPHLPPVVGTTADLAVVRFYGRSPDMDDVGGLRPGDRLAWRYSDDELAEWLPRIAELAATAEEVHVLFNNCYRDHAVANAEEMAAAVTRRSTG